MEKITNVQIPDKQTGDQLFATEVNLYKQKINEAVDELSTTPEAFNSVLTFDKNKYTSSAIAQSGAINYTLAETGNIDGKVIRHKIASDGSPVNFPEGATIYPSSPVFESGKIYSIWMVYLGGDIEVSIPGMATSSIPEEPSDEIQGVSVEPEYYNELTVSWTSGPDQSVQILYSQDNELPDANWQSVTVSEIDKGIVLTGLASGIWYLKLRSTDGSLFGTFTPVYQRTVNDISAAFSITTDKTTQITADTKFIITYPGTMRYAVYPTADATHTKVEITNGTGAIDHGSVDSLGGTVNDVILDGLSPDTRYKVHFYFIGDSIESNVALSQEFLTLDYITYSDDFDDAVIDTTKFTVANPNPSNVTIKEEAGKLQLIANKVGSLALASNSVTSKDSISFGALAIDLSRNVNAVETTILLALGSSTSNWARIIRSSTNPGFIILTIQQNNSTVWSQEMPTVSINNRFKISVDRNNNVRYWVWNTTNLVWDQIGSTINHDLGSSKKLIIQCSDASGGGTAVVNQFDRYRLSNFNYLTELP